MPGSYLFGSLQPLPEGPLIIVQVVCNIFQIFSMVSAGEVMNSVSVSVDVFILSCALG